MPPASEVVSHGVSACSSGMRFDCGHTYHRASGGLSLHVGKTEPIDIRVVSSLSCTPDDDCVEVSGAALDALVAVSVDGVGWDSRSEAFSRDGVSLLALLAWAADSMEADAGGDGGGGSGGPLQSTPSSVFGSFFSLYESGLR